MYVYKSHSVVKKWNVEKGDMLLLVKTRLVQRTLLQNYVA
jgi:hypothetical protein